MSRPVLVDLYCGAGGATRGYQLAGFHVVGVDIVDQPHYVGDEFVRADALEWLADPHWEPGYDAIHASPPCQRFARATAWRGSRTDHPDLLTPTLELLRKVDVPWVVENVPEAIPRPDIQLCGSQFGLSIRRHRHFLTSWPAFSLLSPCYHHRSLLPFMHKGERAFADAMGCDWMTKEEARQAIPPAYTTHIGAQLLAHLQAVAG